MGGVGVMWKGPHFSLDFNEVIRKQPALRWIFHKMLWRFSALYELHGPKMGLWWRRRETIFEAKNPSITTCCPKPRMSPLPLCHREKELKLSEKWSYSSHNKFLNQLCHLPIATLNSLHPCFLLSGLFEDLSSAVMGLSYSLFVHSSIKQSAQDGPGPVVGRSWKPSGRKGGYPPFPNTSLPGISSLKCVFIYIFVFLFWAGRFDTFVPLFLRVFYLLMLVPLVCPTLLRKDQGRFHLT